MRPLFLLAIAALGGSIGAVVVLLFWFWITAFSGILGAELDNVIERRRGVPPK